MMLHVETAEMIARTRRVSARARFEGSADLNGYPFQLLAVTATTGNAWDDITTVLAGAEFLMPYGWELVTVSHPTHSSHSAAAVMRRIPQAR
jgi:hypothetical protein